MNTRQRKRLLAQQDSMDRLLREYPAAVGNGFVRGYWQGALWGATWALQRPGSNLKSPTEMLRAFIEVGGFRSQKTHRPMKKQ